MNRLRQYRRVIYIQVAQDQVTVTDARTGKSVTENSEMPFSSRRLAVGHFYRAADTLKRAYLQLYPRSFSLLEPIIVIHQRYLCEEGLSLVEERVLLELSGLIKSRYRYIWQGEPLSPAQLLAGEYQS
ncbi:hypothetical protein [Photobacterium galatheae]|uniref:Rod shape-determining protein MreB n=1 Tax=Photobacterium galatheae TaxID=1654360 RepID=A0A066RJ23_9GAMM|nr:hypothetical protein [Photobacterium galatheae]KDM90324.1 hypothetical protein EA58_17665 [Photobacterium galatheae]MCM0150795.1 hypothetical protein [Photobacterium galatheae]